jgi:hypothetical protein
MEAKLEIITPQIAEKYLTKNVCNYRRYAKQVAMAYADDMKTGNWKANGEAIKFNKSGFLVDGQHRLNAIIMAQVPVEMMVIRGVEDDIVAYDIGKNRTIGQIARAQNLSPAASNTATLGAVSYMLKCNGCSNVPKQKSLQIIQEECQEWELALECSRVNGGTSPVGKKSAVVLAIYILIKQRANILMLKDFFSVVNSGFPIDGKDCSSAIVLRNYLISDKYTVDSRGFTTRYVAFSATLSAYKDFMEGISRRKPYTLNESHISMLRAMREIAISK